MIYRAMMEAVQSCLKKNNGYKMLDEENQQIIQTIANKISDLDSKQERAPNVSLLHLSSQQEQAVSLPANRRSTRLSGKKRG